MSARAQRVVFFVSLALLLGGCGLPSSVPIALWVDVHPQGWVVFAGSRPPFPPPTNVYYRDDKLLLFHPHLSITVTLLEDPTESFSSPRWLVMPDVDYLFWVAGRQKIYAMTIDFAEIERAISEPLQSKLPFSLHNATLIWTEESGIIQTISPSPNGRYLAFLREDGGHFTVVILDGEATPRQKIAEIPTTWLSHIVWDSAGQAVFVVQESREISYSQHGKIELGEIVRYEITSGAQEVLTEDVAFYQSYYPRGSSSVSAPGPLALSPDGQILYYVTLPTLPPRTAQDLRLGLYSFDLTSRTRRFLTELPTAEALQEIAVSPAGQRVAFTTASARVGFAGAFYSTLFLLEGTQVRQLAQQVNGWLFPFWLDDVHLVYVQFPLEIENEDFPAGVQPALWVHNVETGERSNYLPLLTTQMQLDALRRTVQRLQERIEALEEAIQELQARENSK